MDLDDAIQQRKSVREFKSRKPDWRDIIECIDVTRHAPMAGGHFSVKFVVIDDKKTINRIAEASQQEFIKDAHYAVVVCSDSRMTLEEYPERGGRYVKQQVGAAIQNFLLKIVEKGLATCWVGHFVDEIIKRELAIPENIEVEAIFPIGYEFKKRKPSRKIDIDKILYFHKYKNKKMRKIKKIDV